LLGHILSIENTVAEYRKQLVERADLIRSQRGLEALASAAGIATPRTLSIKEIEDIGPLLEAVKLVTQRVHQNTVAGGKLLGPTGVTFDRWCAIVEIFDAGRNPALEPQEADALVAGNLVQRAYRLGSRT
jgi:hypothetical protein